jgi:hypothetical protein
MDSLRGAKAVGDPIITFCHGPIYENLILTFSPMVSSHLNQPIISARSERDPMLEISAAESLSTVSK